jgi:hypothetical protein
MNEDKDILDKLLSFFNNFFNFIKTSFGFYLAIISTNSYNYIIIKKVVCQLSAIKK